MDKKTIKLGDTEIDSEPASSEMYLKTKKKSYERKINISFHNDKIPKEGSQCICLSVILINSVFRAGKNYCLKVLLEKCKYVVKEKKMHEYITDIELSPDDSDEENLGEENFNEENFNEKNKYKIRLYFISLMSQMIHPYIL